tara:strand:- start:119 stop:370 length:252 start_codon:yes stop_codon:yes gene_type:complete
MNTNNFYTVDEQIYNSTKKQSEINKLIHKIKKGYCNIYLIRKSKNPDVMFVSSMKLAIKKYTKRIRQLQTNKPIIVTLINIEI